MSERTDGVKQVVSYRDDRHLKKICKLVLLLPERVVVPGEGEVEAPAVRLPSLPPATENTKAIDGSR